MLQYLVILLDDTSTSYCHYENTRTERHLISIEDLKTGITFGMKENLMIQFVYPCYELPQDYKEIIDTIDHSNIMPNSDEDADVIVINNYCDLENSLLDYNKTYVLRIKKSDLFSHCSLIKNTLCRVARLNVVITDVESFTDKDFDTYKVCLKEWSNELELLYRNGSWPQFNLITDRIMLNKMNNCGAGDSTIALAPDGRFYVCPAFYINTPCDGSEGSIGETCAKGYSIGSLVEGLKIKNPQLYKLSHAPICRVCDSYHCKRCVWLNRNTTFEVNTPSHQQCVMSHMERNTSREFLNTIKNDISSFQDIVIDELLDYDPFDFVNKTLY